MRGFYPHYLVDFFPATIGYIPIGRVLSVAGSRRDIIKLYGVHRVSLYPLNRFISWHYPYKEEVPYKDDPCAFSNLFVSENLEKTEEGREGWYSNMKQSPMYSRANTLKCLNVYMSRIEDVAAEGWSSVLHTNHQGTRIEGRITRFFAVVLFSSTSPPSRSIRNRKIWHATQRVERLRERVRVDAGGGVGAL
jgi:hypothetical protein